MEGYLRREDTNAAILGLAKDGILIKEIVRRTVHSRNLVSTVFVLPASSVRGTATFAIHPKRLAQA